MFGERHQEREVLFCKRESLKLESLNDMIKFLKLFSNPRKVLPYLNKQLGMIFSKTLLFFA